MAEIKKPEQKPPTQLPAKPPSATPATPAPAVSVSTATLNKPVATEPVPGEAKHDYEWRDLIGDASQKYDHYAKCLHCGYETRTFKLDDMITFIEHHLLGRHRIEAPRGRQL